jgi:small conductance mechanosensitive channel
MKMKMEWAFIHRKLSSALVLSVALLAAAQTARAQGDKGTAAEKPSPVTTADAKIPVDHLKLLVKPLTKAELVVEADGWRDLLKAKGQEIAQLQIAVKQHDATAKQLSEEAASKAAASDKPQEPAAAEAATARKQELAAALPKLQEEQTHLTERFNAVLDALEKKGGDVEVYRKYAAAVTGLDIDVTDAATTWTVLKGWLTSEQGGQHWLWNIVKFLVILVLFYFAASFVANLARHAAGRVQNASQLLVNFLGKFVKQVVMVIGLIVALSALEVNTGPLLAAVGAAGFVIGFALQGTLSNFASGLLILAYRPFDVGDVIEAAGVSGLVDSVSLFSTHIRTFDNKVMIVPNNDIWGGTITNATASDTRRVDMTFGIGYEDDVDKARTILETLLKEHELVLDDPAAVVKLHELADSSVNFVCRPWVKTADYWTVYWDITRAVKDQFDVNGISIPFPQRDIHVYQNSAPSG